jgi:hypothetical protein
VKVKLIEAWWTQLPKAKLRTDLNISENYLEAMWTRLRKEGRIPKQRRRATPTTNRTYVEVSDDSAEERRVKGSDQLLALLIEHHGCCGRFDIPPALLKTLRPPHGIKHSQRDHQRAQHSGWDVRAAAPRHAVKQAHQAELVLPDAKASGQPPRIAGSAVSPGHWSLLAHRVDGQDH